jgi:2-polyprenyl-6-methoxyphenol hydroxylase-like FAD-dependent oxidoreductase
MKNCDVLVRGTGIVGRSLALATARLGLQVALQGALPGPPAADARAYAVNAASVALLRSLKVWDALPAQATTRVLDMHIEGDLPGATLEFSAWQQRVGELAWIVDAGALEAALADAVRYAPHITVHGPDAAPVATLTALCEGKHSRSRDDLGIVFDRHAYGHVAIAARLRTDQAHQGLARQWFRSPDVLALLPFDQPEPGHSYALVWSMPQAQADSLMSVDAAGFDASLADATQGAAGGLTLASDRATWPLMCARAETWCGPGWVLLGDAAHVVHPLAGQGLNLGLADVATLARVLAARESWRSLGDEKLLRRYVRERSAPTWAMTQLTDGLLHLFAHENPALRELRNRGLGLVNQLGPVKRWLTGRALDA